MEVEIAKNNLTIKEIRENDFNIDKCIKKIQKLENDHVMLSQIKNGAENINKLIIIEDKEVDNDLEGKMDQMIIFYESLIKNQENFYEDCLDSIENLENAEKDLKTKLKEMEIKIKEAENDLRKEKDMEIKEYLELKSKIEDTKNDISKKKLIFQEENSQILKLEKEIDKHDLEYKIFKEELDNSKKILEEINLNFDNKKRKLNTMQQDLVNEKKELNILEKENKKIIERTRFLNNEIQNIKGNIRVYLRIKPLSKNEKSTIEIIESNKLILEIPKKHLRSENSKKQYKYDFEHIFNHKSSQEEIFEELHSLMSSVYDGYNVCIFAYGPTGTGKTFTMMGDGSHQYRGLAPRVLERIFEIIEKGKIDNLESIVFMELLEIYQDEIRSLLPENNIRQEITSVLEAFNLLERAIDKRVVTKTECNNESSRSHLVFKLNIVTHDKLTNKKREGNLVLVDLAGSERVQFSKTSGQSFKETLAINKSLSSLGDVIAALYKKDKHIPFRNSKLTLLLQEYLIGDSKALMIVNLSSDTTDYAQTLSSLKFAAQVKNVDSLNQIKKK